jgi:hypothetical protein
MSDIIAKRLAQKPRPGWKKFEEYNRERNEAKQRKELGLDGPAGSP